MTRLALALAVLAILTPFPAAAEIFRYTDAAGVPHYVEGIDSVPQEFRERAVPLRLPPLRTTPAVTPPAATPVRPAPGPVASAPKGGTTIKYTPGKQIMVDVKINGSTSATLLLDTGADSTVINPRVLVAAGASLSRPVATTRVSGVAGSDNVSFVTIESLEIGEARAGRMHVGSYEIAGAGDGLLGRDFLDRFSVNIDSTNGIVTLSPK